MNADQRRAVDLAMDGHSFYLTGQAGTGKSYTLKGIIKALQSKGQKVAVTATTGIACLQLSGGKFNIF